MDTNQPKDAKRRIRMKIANTRMNVKDILHWEIPKLPENTVLESSDTLEYAHIQSLTYQLQNGDGNFLHSSNISI
jgi:hypothetical protein